MANVKMEAGVEVPPARNASQFPLRDLNIGESIRVDCATPQERILLRSRLSAAVQYVQKNTEMRFTIRTEDSQTLRCWRTA